MKSSTMVRHLIRRLLANESITKSMDQVWFGASVTAGIIRPCGESGLPEVYIVITGVQVHRVVELSSRCIAYFVRRINRRTGPSGLGHWFSLDLETALPTDLGQPVDMINSSVIFQVSAEELAGWSPSGEVITFRGSVTEFLDDPLRRPYGRTLAGFFGGTSQAGEYALIHDEAGLLVSLETEKEFFALVRGSSQCRCAGCSY